MLGPPSVIPPIIVIAIIKQPHQIRHTQSAQPSSRALTHRPIRQRFLLHLQVEDALLDCVGDDESLDFDRASLADTVCAVDSLVFRGGIPCQVERDDLYIS